MSTDGRKQAATVHHQSLCLVSRNSACNITRSPRLTRSGGMKKHTVHRAKGLVLENRGHHDTMLLDFSDDLITTIKLILPLKSLQQCIWSTRGSIGFFHALIRS